jgi:hypothetical protein
MEMEGRWVSGGACGDAGHVDGGCLGRCRCLSLPVLASTWVAKLRPNPSAEGMCSAVD